MLCSLFFFLLSLGISLSYNYITKLKMTHCYYNLNQMSSYYMIREKKK